MDDTGRQSSWDGFVATALPMRNEVTEALAATWRDIAGPGDAWTGSERVAIATVARAARSRSPLPEVSLPPAAVAAAQRVAATPGGGSRNEAIGYVEALGETRYVELVGVVACLVAVDVFTRLAAGEVAPLPEPREGRPSPPAEISRLKQRGAWVPTAGPRGPEHAVSAAPAIQRTVNGLIDALFMPHDTADRLGRIRGLARIQAELVILSVSLGNECFY